MEAPARRVHRETWVLPVTMVPQDRREHKEIQDHRDPKEIRDRKEIRVPQEIQVPREIRVLREIQAPQEPQAPRDPSPHRSSMEEIPTQTRLSAPPSIAGVSKFPSD